MTARPRDLLVAALFHFQMNNPVWPEAQPWGTIVFAIAAVIVVVSSRRTMPTGGDAVTDVLAPAGGTQPGF